MVQERNDARHMTDKIASDVLEAAKKKSGTKKMIRVIIYPFVHSVCFGSSALPRKKKMGIEPFIVVVLRSHLVYVYMIRYSCRDLSWNA